jgi:hypothetical protein
LVLTLSVSPVGEAVGDGGDDSGPVLLDPVELDERWNLGPSSPVEPRVEHGDRLRPAVLEHEAKLFLHGHLPVGRTGGYDA